MTISLKDLKLSTEMLDASQMASTFIHKDGTLDEGTMNLSGDIKLDGIYLQKPSNDTYTNVYGRNSFVQAETVLKADGSSKKYQSSSAGTKGWVIIGIDDADHKLKLSGDCSVLDSHLNKTLFSVSLGDQAFTEFTKITKVESNYVTLETWNEYLTSMKDKTEADLIKLYKEDDNGFFTFSNPDMGNQVLENFYGCHAEGGSVKAIGRYSHAEGRRTVAGHRYSHAEGEGGSALGSASHVEGTVSKAVGNYSHAEGNKTFSYGNSAHTEGSETSAMTSYAHAEGYKTKASGYYSHVEGAGTNATEAGSHAEGYLTKALSVYSHAEGYGTTASGEASHTEGCNTRANGKNSHAEGYNNYANGHYSHSEGAETSALGEYSHAEGYHTNALSNFSHAEGYVTIASGSQSHAEGGNTEARGSASHAEGKYSNALGDYSHCSGRNGVVYSKDTFLWTASDASDTKFEVNNEGTFNINPRNGSSGFYIGKNSLKSMLDNMIDKICAAANITDNTKITEIKAQIK